MAYGTPLGQMYGDYLNWRNGVPPSLQDSVAADVDAIIASHDRAPQEKVGTLTRYFRKPDEQLGPLYGRNAYDTRDRWEAIDPDMVNAVGLGGWNMLHPEQRQQIVEQNRAALAGEGPGTVGIDMSRPLDRGQQMPSPYTKTDEAKKQNYLTRMNMARGASTQEDVDRLDALGGDTRDYATRLAERKARAAMRGLGRGAVREAQRGNLGPMQDLAMERAGGEDGEGPQLLPVGLARSPQEAALVNQHNSGVLEYRAQMARNKSEGDRWQADQLRQAGLDWDNVYATNSQLLGDPEAAYELTVQQRGGRPSGAMIGPPVPGSPTAASGDVTLYQAGRVRQRALENPGVVAIGITPTSSPADVASAIRRRIASGGAVDPASLRGLRDLVASMATDPAAMASLNDADRQLLEAVRTGAAWSGVQSHQRGVESRARAERDAMGSEMLNRAFDTGMR